MAVRTHIMVPEHLLDEVDRIAGRRKRSDFFVEAVQEKLIRERQRTMIPRFAGIFKDVDIPGWETPERTYEWIRELRERADLNTG